jgi:hypothetical protein
MFTQQYRKEQAAAGTKVSPQELTALAASQWRVMGGKEREPFVAAAQAERAAVDGQYRAWKEANPDVPTGYSKVRKDRKREHC